jgi:hypothetical protein
MQSIPTYLRFRRIRPKRRLHIMSFKSWKKQDRERQPGQEWNDSYCKWADNNSKRIVPMITNCGTKFLPIWSPKGHKYARYVLHSEENRLRRGGRNIPNIFSSAPFKRGIADALITLLELIQEKIKQLKTMVNMCNIARLLIQLAFSQTVWKGFYFDI